MIPVDMKAMRVITAYWGVEAGMVLLTVTLTGGFSITVSLQMIVPFSAV
jgi:hypothetical protein